MSSNPRVGDVMVVEVGHTQRRWTVTRITPKGTQAVVESPAITQDATGGASAPVVSRVYRNAAGRWHFDGAPVVFIPADDPRLETLPNLGDTATVTGHDQPWTVMSILHYGVMIKGWDAEGRSCSAVAQYQDGAWRMGSGQTVTFGDVAVETEPVITIDITDSGSALGYVRNLPEDQGWSIYGNRDPYSGHWTVWSDAHGSATRSKLPAALKAWAKQYGIAHGRALGENEVRGRKIDISW